MENLFYDYLTDQGNTMTPYELAQRIGILLSQKKLKLTTVESCTGGSLAKLITDIPGASEWFDCGFITYSNESKIRSSMCLQS